MYMWSGLSFLSRGLLDGAGRRTADPRLRRAVPFSTRKPSCQHCQIQGALDLGRGYGGWVGHGERLHHILADLRTAGNVGRPEDCRAWDGLVHVRRRSRRAACRVPALSSEQAVDSDGSDRGGDDGYTYGPPLHRIGDADCPLSTYSVGFPSATSR